MVGLMELARAQWRVFVMVELTAHSTVTMKVVYLDAKLPAASKEIGKVLVREQMKVRHWGVGLVLMLDGMLAE